MAKARRCNRGSGRRTGGRAATRTGTAASGRSEGRASKRLPFLVLQAPAGAALLGFAVAFDSLPVLPVLALVLCVCGLTALPALADGGSPDRRRH